MGSTHQQQPEGGVDGCPDWQGSILSNISD